MFQKNQSFTGTVIDLTLEGNGVCKVDGFSFFIPKTAKGDVIRFKAVKVLSSYGYGIIEEILSPSPDRIENDCAAFSQCGGCLFRHIRYEAELAIKEKAVSDAFSRIGGFSLKPEPILSGKTLGYRNKAQFPFGKDKDGNVVLGFFAKRSHRLIPVTDCKIEDAAFSQIAAATASWANEENVPVYDEKTKQGILRHLFLRTGKATGEILYTLVVADESVPGLPTLLKTIRERFPSVTGILINVNTKDTNVILGKKYIPLWGKQQLSDRLLDTDFHISPAAFYQVNHDMTERLYQLAYDYADFSGEEFLLDLYCGIGSVGLCAYRKLNRLLGVEIVPEAVASARENAKQNGFSKAEFLTADAAKAASELAKKGLSPDVIMVDPPRKGCDKLTLESIVQMAPKKIVMISCNPATAARDCKLLSEMGYAPTRIRPADLFPRTGHVETVILLSKLNIKQHIEVELNLDEMDGRK